VQNRYCVANRLPSTALIFSLTHSVSLGIIFISTAVISAWGKSRSIGKSVKSRRVLNKMIDLHESGRLSACPNTVCYTAVINSCAYCENDDMDKRNALRIAIGTYKDLEKSNYGSPNQVTYSNLLTALRNLLPWSPKRSVAIQDLFESAAKNGYVDQIVVQRVKCTLIVVLCVCLSMASISQLITLFHFGFA
jgi:hypothetical protein